MILSEAELNAMSALALAHMGDAVYELLVRRELCRQGKLTAGELHRQTVRRVTASAQARAAKRIRPLLTGEEDAVFRRGRNSHSHAAPASCTEESTTPPPAWRPCSGGSISGRRRTGWKNCFP